MKKLIAISLISILLLQFNEIFLIFKAQQFWIRQQMKQSLMEEDCDFQKITLDLNEYQKSKINANELLIDGEMYDVKSVHIKDNVVELLVLSDEEEKEKINAIEELVIRGEQTDDDFPQQIGFLLLNYISPDLLNSLFVPLTSILRFENYNSKPISVYSGIFDPPPELA